MSSLEKQESKEKRECKPKTTNSNANQKDPSRRQPIHPSYPSASTPYRYPRRKAPINQSKCHEMSTLACFTSRRHIINNCNFTQPSCQPA
jgi:hypothetical protein